MGDPNGTHNLALKFAGNFTQDSFTLQRDRDKHDHRAPDAARASAGRRAARPADVDGRSTSLTQRRALSVQLRL